MTLWGPSNLQSSAMNSLFDSLPESLKDPEGPPPTLSEYCGFHCAVSLQHWQSSIAGVQLRQRFAK
jgi:hypothetical protein